MCVYEYIYIYMFDDVCSLKSYMVVRTLCLIEV